MNRFRIMEVNQAQSDQNQFRFAGNSLVHLSQSDHLPTRQAVADQYSSPQENYGSLLNVLETEKSWKT